MQTNNQHRDDHSDERALDKIIDVGLVSFPIEPLPDGFTQRLMSSVATDSSTKLSLSTAKSTPVSPLSYLTRQNLLWFGQILYREALSVRDQVRSTDVTIAALFALLWCIVAGSFIWTERLVPWQGNANQLTWLIPLCTVIGGFLTLGMLGIFLYLEQRDS